MELSLYDMCALNGCVHLNGNDVITTCGVHLNRNDVITTCVPLNEMMSL